MWGKDTMEVKSHTCFLTSTTTITECQPLGGVAAGRVGLVFLAQDGDAGVSTVVSFLSCRGTLLPGYCCHGFLQSTNGHMHTIRTIHIGSHEQRAMYAYMHWLKSRQHVFTRSDQAIDRHEKNFQNDDDAKWSREIITMATQLQKWYMHAIDNLYHLLLHTALMPCNNKNSINALGFNRMHLFAFLIFGLIVCHGSHGFSIKGRDGFRHSWKTHANAIDLIASHWLAKLCRCQLAGRFKMRQMDSTNVLLSLVLSILTGCCFGEYMCISKRRSNFTVLTKVVSMPVPSALLALSQSAVQVITLTSAPLQACSGLK